MTLAEENASLRLRLERAREALRTFLTLGVECIRDGRTCPAEGCDCDSCETHREAAAAIADDVSTPSTPGPMTDGTKLNRWAYQKLIDEDISWLLKQPRTLEREHVHLILKTSTVDTYGPEPAPSAEPPCPEAGCNGTDRHCPRYPSHAPATDADEAAQRLKVSKAVRGFLEPAPSAEPQCRHLDTYINTGRCMHCGKLPEYLDPEPATDPEPRGEPRHVAVCRCGDRWCDHVGDALVQAHGQGQEQAIADMKRNGWVPPEELAKIRAELEGHKARDKRMFDAAIGAGKASAAAIERAEKAEAENHANTRALMERDELLQATRAERNTWKTVAKAHHANRFEHQEENKKLRAKLAEAREQRNNAQADAELLTAKLDRVSRGAAAMREALEKCVDRFDGDCPERLGSLIETALASDAGRGWVPEAEVERRVAEELEASAKRVESAFGYKAIWPAQAAAVIRARGKS